MPNGTLGDNPLSDLNSSQPLAAVKSTFNFMKEFLMFATRSDQPWLSSVLLALTRYCFDTARAFAAAWCSPIILHLLNATHPYVSPH